MLCEMDKTGCNAGAILYCKWAKMTISIHVWIFPANTPRQNGFKKYQPQYQFPNSLILI